MAKKWLPVPGFIGFFTLIAGFLIQDYVLLLSKWNSITRYPVIFNFHVGTGRVLEKKFGAGRVPGSRQSLVGVVSIAAQLSVNVTASPSWANEERLAGLVQPLPQLRINSTDWNILLLNKHINAYINLTSWQNGTIYFFPTNFCLRKPKMLEYLRSHRLHRTMFQLMVPLPKHDLKRNMTGQRMHIEGPQILESMFY